MELWQLQQRQALPLEAKINLSLDRIRQWYEHWDGDVYVSFSGGKDSTVLLDLVRQQYPDVPGVYVDTGLEYPEVRDFVKTVANVIWLKPKMAFSKVVEKYGYPVVSKEQSRFLFEYQTGKSEKLKDIRLNGNKWGMGKISKKWLYLLDAPFKASHKCCDVLKKNPIKAFEKLTGLYPYLGTMAVESKMRTQGYLRTGCNAFKQTRPTSQPISIWLDTDIWDYIKAKNIPYASIYDTGVERTGCMGCMFGLHLEDEPNRIQRIEVTHPHIHNYLVKHLHYDEVLSYMNIPYRMEDSYA
jgi:3'-phosphoadenosine 5'-phosphosulfate sulfotransferase (PAPS reductase)/FAD synthetase